MSSNEIWKTIPFSPKYEASNIGRIRRQYNKKIRVQTIHHGFYYKINLPVSNKTNIEKLTNIYTHRAIIESFIGERPNGCEIDHIDRDKLNNNLDNLRYCNKNVNQANRKNKSKYGTGVTKNCSRYCSEIKVNGNRIYLGRFDTPQEASKAYQDRLKEVING